VGVIVPVDGLIETAAGAVNVPPVVPVTVASTKSVDVQNGPPLYDTVEDGIAVIVTVAVAV
jgi:hypothetical protein